MKIIFGIFLFGSVGCFTGGDNGDGGADPVLLPGDTIDDPAPLITRCAGLPDDAFELHSAMTIEPDRILRVSVSYSGGCEDHTFAACWNGGISKSNPATLTVSLHHDNRGDNCEAYITRDLFIDLSPTPAGFGSPERDAATSIRLTEQ